MLEFWLACDIEKPDSGGGMTPLVAAADLARLAATRIPARWRRRHPARMVRKARRGADRNWRVPGDRAAGRGSEPVISGSAAALGGGGWPRLGRGQPAIDQMRRRRAVATRASNATPMRAMLPGSGTKPVLARMSLSVSCPNDQSPPGPVPRSKLTVKV